MSQNKPASEGLTERELARFNAWAATRLWQKNQQDIAWIGWIAHALSTPKVARDNEALDAERERCAAICDDEARIRAEAGRCHAEDSPERDRCFAGARAAMNCARGIRSGEAIDAAMAQEGASKERG